MCVIWVVFEMIGECLNVMMYGIKCEVFICEMVSNIVVFLKGEVVDFDFSDLKMVEEVVGLVCQCWLILCVSWDISY